MAKNLPSNRKLPGIFTFNLFSGICDASDTAEEPLGGLKGHPGLRWRDWLCQFETPYVTPCTAQNVAIFNSCQSCHCRSHVYEH